MTTPYNSRQLQVIDERILRAAVKRDAVGTVVSAEPDRLRARVVFDGATTDTPVKVRGDIWCEAGDRVLLDCYGKSDWYITGVTNRICGPNGAGVSQAGVTGTSTTSTPANVPGTPVFTWSKRWDTTPILMHAGMSLYNTGAVNSWGCALGFTDAAAVQTIYTVWTVEGGAALTRLGYSYSRTIPDAATPTVLPAGEYTVNLMWFRATGAGTLNMTTAQDYVSAHVLELGV